MSRVNYIEHLNGVFGKFTIDSRLNPPHISLYFALFTLWNSHYFRNPFFINRQEVMTLSKIGSKSTYHRCLKELTHWGYIRYEPSHNPLKGSQVTMFNFGLERSEDNMDTCTNSGTSTGQALYQGRTTFGTSSGQVVVPYIKHIQTKKNSENLNKQENSKNENFKNLKKAGKLIRGVPNGDNLHVEKKKNYNEPL